MEKRSRLKPGIILGIIMFRILNALVVRTYFNPDEYWQGPEVAHVLVFGTGMLTWEWLPGARIRSFIHPLMIAGFYMLLKLTGLDTRDAVAYGHSILQAIFAAVADLYVYHLGLRIFSSQSLARWALFMQLSNWFNFYCLVRTFSSSLEASLAAPAVYHWLSTTSYLTKARQGKKDEETAAAKAGLLLLPPRAISCEERVALMLGALCVIIRPTAIFLWIPLGLCRLWYTRQPLWYIIREVVAIVGLVIIASTLLDSFFYGCWTFTPLNFLRFNLLEDKASLYGTHPFHWYWSQGIATVLTTQLPFVGLGLWQALFVASSSSSSAAARAEKAKEEQEGQTSASSSAAATAAIAKREEEGEDTFGLFPIALAVIAYPLGLSLSPHKEFRFLLPILPLTSLLAAKGLEALYRWLYTPSFSPPFAFVSKIRTTRSQSSQPTTTVTAASDGGRQQQQGQRRYAIHVILFMIITQAPLAIYLSTIHQRGPIDVMKYLSTALRQDHLLATTASSNRRSIDFLMPCHATPWTSYLHVPGIYPHLHLRHLDCSATARSSKEGTESDRFLRGPLAFTRALYDNSDDGQSTLCENENDSMSHASLPRYVVTFGSAASVLDRYLSEKGYIQDASFFYSAFKGDVDSANLEDSIVVFKHIGR